MKLSLFRRSLVVATLAASALLVAPLGAQSAEKGKSPNSEATGAPDFAAMTGLEAFRMFNEQRNRVTRESCDFGVPLLRAMARAEPDNQPVVRYELFVQALCADAEKRFEDGAALARQINALDPATPEVGLSLYFARQTGDADWALEMLNSLDRDQLADLSSDSLWNSVRAVRKQGRGDEVEAMMLKWYEDGQFPFFDGDLWEPLARNALAAAAKQGRGDIARQLLGYITSPGIYIDLLTQRRFAPIWPEIEARAGGNLEQVGAENVAIARQRLTNAPRDRDRFSDAAYALHFNGDYEAVIALAQSWRDREERGLGIEEGDAWALNLQAYAFDALGQPERADAVFDELASYDPDEHGWVVNFVINRASRLVGYGRWEEGLAAAQLARTVRGSTYAEMIIAKDHACALAALGRADETAVELDFLRENTVESPALAAQGLLCLGLRDEAAALLIEALGETSTRADAINAVLPPEADLFYTESILPSARNLLGEYPALAAAFAEHARDLPDAFIPRASMLRAELDLPAWELR